MSHGRNQRSIIVQFTVLGLRRSHSPVAKPCITHLNMCILDTELGCNLAMVMSPKLVFVSGASSGETDGPHIWHKSTVTLHPSPLQLWGVTVKALSLFLISVLLSQRDLAQSRLMTQQNFPFFFWQTTEGKANTPDHMSFSKAVFSFLTRHVR